MELIAEQLRNGRITPEEACRRAADKLPDSSLEFILRRVGSTADNQEGEIEDLQRELEESGDSDEMDDIKRILRGDTTTAHEKVETLKEMLCIE